VKKILSSILCLMLAIGLIFNFAACSDDKSDKTGKTGISGTSGNGGITTSGNAQDADLVKFIDEQGDELLSGFESSFEQSSGGLDCECSWEIDGTALTLNCLINGVDDVPEANKQEMQDIYDSQNDTFHSLFAPIKDEVPNLSNVTIKVCEEDGDLLADISLDY